MSLLSPLLLAATLVTHGGVQPDTAALRGARQPATAVNGAVVFAHDGQLYLQRSIGSAVVAKLAPRHEIVPVSRSKATLKC